MPPIKRQEAWEGFPERKEHRLEWRLQGLALPLTRTISPRGPLGCICPEKKVTIYPRVSGSSLENESILSALLILKGTRSGFDKDYRQQLHEIITVHNGAFRNILSKFITWQSLIPAAGALIKLKSDVITPLVSEQQRAVTVKSVSNSLSISSTNIWSTPAAYKSQ